MPRARRAAIGIVLTLAVSACATTDLHALNGTRWQAVQIGDIVAVPTLRPTIAFKGGGASGTGLCATYVIGTLTIDQTASPPRLMLGDVTTTTGCPNDEWERIDRTYFGALTQAQSIQAVGNQLIVSGPGGRIVFERLPGPG